MSKTMKQSLITGALASTFGVFLSKVLGLLYVVPLNELAGDANMAFYSITYTYYDILLRISSAGIPFAIAALVAKYYSREDYRTMLLVKKIGTSLLLVSGFVIAVVFVLFSSPIASQVLGSMASSEDIEILHNLFMILAISLVLVPLLSAYRGYYQGLKMLNQYAASQVLEQLLRVASIVVLGFVCVKVFSLDNIYAIYMAILAAAIGALFAIVYLLISGRKIDHDVKILAQNAREGRGGKDVFIELLSLGLPYLLVALLGLVPSFIDSTFFIDFSTSVGYGYEDMMLSFGIIRVNCTKLASIPMVLATGFGAGLVPYLVETLEKQDFHLLNKQINEIFNTVLFILLPIILWMIVYVRPIYYIMYGGENIDLGAHMMQIYMAVALIDTIGQICSSMAITLNLKKKMIYITIIGSFVKLLAFFVMVYLWGAYGLIFSAIVSGLVMIALDIWTFYQNFNIDFSLLFKRIIIMLGVSLLSCLPFFLSYLLPFNYNSRLLCLLILGVFGMMSLLIYVLVSDYLGFFKLLFKKDLRSYVRGLLKR